MLKQTPKLSALNKKLLLGFASVLMFGIAAMIPAHAQIKIGFQAPLTGPSADFGTSVQQGAELAVREINAAGGVLGRPLELVVKDDRGDPATGQAAATTLVTVDRVDATIGFCNTGVAMQSLDVFESHHQLLIVPCAQGTAITRRARSQDSMVFRVAPVDALNAQFLVGEIVDRRHLARVAILADTTGYGDGGVADVGAQLARRGLAPAYVGRFAADAPSLDGLLRAARAACSRPSSDGASVAKRPT